MWIILIVSLLLGLLGGGGFLYYRNIHAPLPKKCEEIAKKHGWNINLSTMPYQTNQEDGKLYPYEDMKDLPFKGLKSEQYAYDNGYIWMCTLAKKGGLENKKKMEYNCKGTTYKMKDWTYGSDGFLYAGRIPEEQEEKEKFLKVVNGFMLGQEKACEDMLGKK